MLPANDLKEIASRGGGMVMEVSSVTTDELKEIASRASSGGGLIFLKKPNKLKPNEFKEIASRGNGHVVFDFTS